MIEVKGIHSYYGKSHILHGVKCKEGSWSVFSEEWWQVDDAEEHHGGC